MGSQQVSRIKFSSIFASLVVRILLQRRLNQIHDLRQGSGGAVLCISGGAVLEHRPVW